jgi:WD40 repeat protein
MSASETLLASISSALQDVLAQPIKEEVRLPLCVSVALGAWTSWTRATTIEARRSDFQMLLQRDDGSLAEYIAKTTQMVGDEALRARISAYLQCFRSSIRRTLVGPTHDKIDSFAGCSFRDAQELLPFLPSALPRFRPQQRPLPGAAWELEELMGVSEFGELWRARRSAGGETAVAALKFCTDPTVLHSLKSHEATALERCAFYGRHSGLVPLTELYLKADPPCLVYEFVDGPDLTAVIHAFHRQPERSAATSFAWSAALIFELSGILAFAHRMTPPLVHLDLKPSNIKVQRRADGRSSLRLTDLGIGGLSSSQGVALSRIPRARSEIRAQSLAGSYTPLYVSPQQLGGAPPDPRDDVYALGIIWYQMITGNLAAGKPQGLEWTHRLHKLGMNADLLELLTSCLEEHQEDRPADAGDLASRLENSFRAVRQETYEATDRSSSTVQAGVLQRVRERDVPKSDPKSSDVLQGHTEAVLALSFSHDGQFIASGGKEGVLRIWSVADGKEIRQYPVSAGGINCVDYSQDGRLILTGGKDTRIRLLDAETGKELRTFEGHMQRVWSSLFSPNGRRAISGSGDGTLRLWDVYTGQVLRRIDGHRARVWSVAFSSDGINAVSGSDDTTVRLWDVESGKELRKFTGHTYRVWSVAISFDGQSILSGSDDTTVRLWSARRGLLGMKSSREARRFEGHKADVRSVAFSPDGTRILSGGGDKTVRLWDVASGKEILRLEGHEEAVRCVSFSPDGRLVASSGLDASVRIWKLPPQL